MNLNTFLSINNHLLYYFQYDIKMHTIVIFQQGVLYTTVVTTLLLRHFIC